MMGYTYQGIVLAVFIVLITKIWQFCWIFLWKPYTLTKIFDNQGIKGPPYSILYGSLHKMKIMRKAVNEMVLATNCNDIYQKILPHYHKWSAEFGEIFLFWYGPQPSISIQDPELAKQVLSNNSGFYVKSKMRPKLTALMGNGLGLLSGPEWMRHRKILNPAFNMDKIKVMTKRMAACTLDMIDDWKNKLLVADHHDITIEMSGELQKLTADIIAHTAFGSSYDEGREAFEAQKELQKHCIATLTSVIDMLGSRFLPTPSNLQMWKLDNKVKNSIRHIIKGRIESVQSKKKSDGCYGDDILGLMIEALETTDKSLKLNMEEIVEECKTFFFAGHETTSNLLTWTTFLLSSHQEWQDKLREEVLRECGKGIPEVDMLPKLKLVNMVLFESLRLYSPVLELNREASKDLKLGNYQIPKGVLITMQFAKIHTSKEYWGEDANEFNPLRFKNGVSHAAKHPNALLAFGLGPRACIGQNFSMLEAKMVLSLLLQRFSFFLSPEYKHAPTFCLFLQPQYGLPIIVKPLLSKEQPCFTVTPKFTRL